MGFPLGGGGGGGGGIHGNSRRGCAARYSKFSYYGLYKGVYNRLKKKGLKASS